MATSLACSQIHISLAGTFQFHLPRSSSAILVATWFQSILFSSLGASAAGALGVVTMAIGLQGLYEDAQNPNLFAANPAKPATGTTLAKQNTQPTTAKTYTKAEIDTMEERLLTTVSELNDRIDALGSQDLKNGWQGIINNPDARIELEPGLSKPNGQPLYGSCTAFPSCTAPNATRGPIMKIGALNFSSQNPLELQDTIIHEGPGHWYMKLPDTGSPNVYDWTADQLRQLYPPTQ